MKPPEQMLDRDQVLAKVHVGKATLKMLMARKGFPLPVQIAPRILRWRLSQVESWLARAQEMVMR